MDQTLVNNPEDEESETTPVRFDDQTGENGDEEEENGEEANSADKVLEGDDQLNEF